MASIMSMGAIKRTQADINFSIAVRMFRKECEHCHGPAQELAHFYGRRSHSTRYCVMNSFSLCRNCHRHFGENPSDFHQFYIKYRGDEMWQKVTIQKNKGFLKNNADTRSRVSKHYLNQIRLMKADSNHILESWN